MKRMLPPEKRATAKALIRQWRKARGLTIDELAALVGIRPKSLEEFERLGGPCPGRPLFADLGFVLASAQMLTLMLPDGWVALSPEQVELVRDALVAAGILPPG